MPAPTTTVDTKHVTDRRKLAFRSIADLNADIAALVAAERAGTLRASGNWTLGQAFGHLAFWINAPFDGYPPDLNPPWFVKLLLRLMKKRYMTALPAGVRIPNIPGGTKGIDPLTTQEGLSRITAALSRLQSRPPERPNLIFGPLSHEEWITMHLRHAELHLSFFHPTA